MLTSLFAAAAVATMQPQPQVTAQTPLTVTLPIWVLEAAKTALHKRYTGDEVDALIGEISKAENDAMDRLKSSPEACIKGAPLANGASEPAAARAETASSPSK